MEEDRIEEAAWSVCREMLRVDARDPAYLLGPKKLGVRWPDDGGPSNYHGPRSYQFSDHKQNLVSDMRRTGRQAIQGLVDALTPDRPVGNGGVPAPRVPVVGRGKGL